MKLWIAIVVLMFATVGHAGKAEATNYFWTGSQLLELCENDSVAQYAGCTGFILGVSDTTASYNDTDVMMVTLYCTPDNVTIGQLQKVVIKSLTEDPASLHQAASGLVVSAFMDAFPCD
ncbi:Rap1a/Tai family immunity protein [Luminiphilus sp.]|nr:Rap1a/Tai family immunity protein [Luminiphilus sp.]MDA9625670.1 Rap1a/Tai family immunity protein [Luminiphilus sp.]